MIDSSVPSVSPDQTVRSAVETMVKGVCVCGVCVCVPVGFSVCMKGEGGTDTWEKFCGSDCGRDRRCVGLCVYVCACPWCLAGEVLSLIHI